MAARLSGSTIVYEAYDLNAALMTADGRGLCCGVYIMHHGATIDEFVRRVLADWPAEEIREGDMFFTNDPWWGALHANDGILAMPIFWEGRLVAWSGIVMHDSDVGSPVPGSFVTGAVDRFGEAPLFPAIRMVVDFEPLVDVERAYLRNSRTPELNALNMRARVAALRMTYRRITELIERYGIDTFLAAQEAIIDYVERVVRSRLADIPDGTWFAHGYHDHDGVNELIYPLCCRLTKDRDGLLFDLTGTAPQAPGPINCARPALEGAVMGVILTFLCYDLPWAIGGLRPLARIEVPDGTLVSAASPAAVSMASIMGGALGPGRRRPRVRRDAAVLRAPSHRGPGQLGAGDLRRHVSPRRRPTAPRRSRSSRRASAAAAPRARSRTGSTAAACSIRWHLASRTRRRSRAADTYSRSSGARRPTAAAPDASAAARESSTR